MLTPRLGEDGSDDERKLSGDDDLPRGRVQFGRGHSATRGPKYKRGLGPNNFIADVFLGHLIPTGRTLTMHTFS